MPQSDVDRLLFSIGIHGPSVAFDNLKMLKKFYKFDRPAFERVRIELLQWGMDRWDVLDLVTPTGPHDRDCACWRCIGRLHFAVLRHQSRMRADNYDPEGNPCAR
jgi:hypothetical protein